jgi:glycosyltransferase involved in cell wall biosynthesis
MKLIVNAASAKTGGAVTYLRTVVPALGDAVASAGSPLVLWAPEGVLGGAETAAVRLRDPGHGHGASRLSGIAGRVWFDQVEIPRRIREDRADALFSSANFGTLRSPVRQVLLVRNSLYFDAVAMKRIRSPVVRARYVAQRWLTLRSVRAADAVLFPTRAMLDLVAPHVDGPQPTWQVSPYGASHHLFRPEPRAQPSGGPVGLLNVSLYCDQKNLGTLLAALERLDARSPGEYRLRLTAGFKAVEPGPWHPNLEAERSAFYRLEAAGVVDDIDRQSYADLPALYRAADIFVFPSYTESFGHPLVEAMASGLPVVAADVPVHREMCGDAAIYFPAFDAEACAAAIERVARSSELAARLATNGLARAREFTWERHVRTLVVALRGAA